jgi:hypothetical protein
MCASESRENDAEPGQSGVDFVLLSLLAYELFAFTLEEHTREGLTVMAEEFVLIQRKGGDWRSVLQLATGLRQSLP